ncbi:class I SAM-dependent methyltransferase [Candidatus Nitrosotalea okcheonensis]|nr:class I SAM-dependent methyltransferase [Candidatus Nitrosotalea okcheonensis]MDE1728115.1 class I SAM-dependent methyltransferase [Nitrososphaerota archaeon]MDE1830874.1 class I SAM-dependent methyltransferase [Nitrososphaerota archaeon]
MNNPNPMDVILWTLRRGEGDIVNMYNYLSELMQISTGRNFLNFGYWDNATKSPADAQTNLCNLIGDMAELENARHILDVGSGFSEPAFLWKKAYPNITITCLNINPNQLKFANIQKKISEINLVNATAVKIPISDRSCDRIIALESAQHFRPIKEFISETGRILKKDGTAVFAIPVLSKPSKFSVLKIGILKMTWSSEHYDIDAIKKIIQDIGLNITEIRLVGSNVYPPLAEYYIQNHRFLRSEILKRYPSYVETILFRSMLKMKQAATNHTIEYVLIKCTK